MNIKRISPEYNIQGLLEDKLAVFTKLYREYLEYYQEIEKANSMNSDKSCQLSTNMRHKIT